jgi:hypothetical protein
MCALRSDQIAGEDFVSHLFDFFERDHTGAEEGDFAMGDGDDGGFYAHAGGSAIEDWDGVAECRSNVGGGGGGELPESIGAGGGKGDSGGFDQLEGEGVSGDSDADGRQSSGDDIGDARRLGKNQGKRAGPPALHELIGFVRPLGDQSAGHLNRRGVDDERAGFGAAFHFVDFRDGGGVEGVGAQPVDGFGGEGDEAAVA